MGYADQKSLIHGGSDGYVFCWGPRQNQTGGFMLWLIGVGNLGLHVLFLLNKLHFILYNCPKREIAI